MQTEKSNLIHVRIAARRYGLPVKWLKGQAKAGKIPALVADNQVLFDRSILAKWLADHAKGGLQT